MSSSGLFLNHVFSMIYHVSIGSIIFSILGMYYVTIDRSGSSWDILERYTFVHVFFDGSGFDVAAFSDNDAGQDKNDENWQEQQGYYEK